MEKIAEACGLSDATVKAADPVKQLCREKGNSPLKRCATQALMPITKIKNNTVRTAVISEANELLRQRTNDGKEFIRKRLSQKEVEGLIEKYQPSSKKPIVTELPPRFKLNKSQHNVLKRMVSLKLAANEREAFLLLFVWAAERISKKK